MIRRRESLTTTKCNRNGGNNYEKGKLNKGGGGKAAPGQV